MQSCNNETESLKISQRQKLDEQRSDLCSDASNARKARKNFWDNTHCISRKFLSKTDEAERSISTQSRRLSYKEHKEDA